MHFIVATGTLLKIRCHCEAALAVVAIQQVKKMKVESLKRHLAKSLGLDILLFYFLLCTFNLTNV